MSKTSGLPTVVIVVVEHNGLRDTTACVDSLLRLDYPAARVVVVDNGSDADETTVLSERYGEAVHVLRAERNDGYGAGANIGIRWASSVEAEFIWLLNNDTIVERDSLSRLVDAVTTDPAIGIASPQIAAPEGPDAPLGVWYAGGTLSLARARTQHLTVRLAPAAKVVDTKFVTGCAPLMRLKMLHEIGLFWESLFLFWEDTDLLLRAQAAGWRTCVVPAAWIFHRVHGSTPDSVVDRFHFRNALIVVCRNGTALQTVLAVASTGAVVGRLWAAALFGRRRWPVDATTGFVAGIRWILSRNITRLSPSRHRRDGSSP